MPSTFTLTGTFKHQDNITPVVNSGVKVNTLPYPDGTAPAIYAGGVKTATDGNGHFSMTLVTEPGLRYTVRSLAGHPLFDPVTFAAPSAGATLDVATLVPYDPSGYTPTLVTQAQTAATNAAASATAAQTAAANIPASWQASTAYNAGDVRIAPDGTSISRNATGTSRSSFDTTEQAAWTVQAVKSGTLLQQSVLSVSETAPAVQRYYQAGDTDYTAALGRAVSAAPKLLRIPPSSTAYGVTATTTIPGGMSVLIEKGATVQATGTIAGPVFDTAVSTKHTEGQFNCLGQIDCNNKAQTGLYLRFFADYSIPRIDVRSPTSHAVIIGDPGAAGVSYGLRMGELYVNTPSGGRAVPAGSRGLWMQYASDSKVAAGTIVGQDIGTRNDQGNNRFGRIHVWGFSGANPSICFDDNAFDSAFYESCMADTPSAYGWRVRSSAYVSYIDCTVFNNSIFGSDNVVTGVQYDASNPVFSWLGGWVDGVSGHRLAKDFGSTAGGINAAFYMPAKDSQFVVAKINPAGQQFSMANLRLNGLLRSVYTGQNVSASDGSGVSTLIVDSSAGSRRVSLNNSADLRMYTDNGSTIGFQVVGANGAVRPGACTTATRPTGAALVTRAIIFDTSIQRYIYHDGTNWKDFAGNTV